MNLHAFIIPILCFLAPSALSHAGDTTSCVKSHQDSSARVRGYCIPVRFDGESSLAFGSGERLRLTAHYQWGAINSDVGWADVALDTVMFNGIKAFHCQASGSTTKLFDLFFKVREDFQSWFTRDGLVPLRFTRDSREGKYHATNDYRYMWEKDTSYIAADVFSTHAGSKTMELPLDRCTYDLPALFFLARNMDFDSVDEGVRYPMTFAIDDEVYNVYFILIGRENVKLRGLGTVKTIKFAAKLLAGEVFTGEQDMLIWISDDRNRIPVYVEAPLRVGVATARLAGYSGLKYPFSSLIKKK